MVKKYWRKKASEPLLIGGSVYELLKGMGGAPEKGRLTLLWTHWAEAVGEELAAITMPLGSKERTLLIRAEDALQMQELHYHTPELLERVNEYLKSDYFVSAHISIFGDEKNCPPPETENRREVLPTLSDRPLLTGKYLALMRQSSPVTACYALFARRSRNYR